MFNVTPRMRHYWGQDGNPINIAGAGGPIGPKFKPRTSRGKTRPRTKGRY